MVYMETIAYTLMVIGQTWPTTNLALCVCVCVRVRACVRVCVCRCAKVDQFLPGRSHFDSKRPENCVRIATFRFLRSIVLYCLRKTII